MGLNLTKVLSGGTPSTNLQRLWYATTAPFGLRSTDEAGLNRNYGRLQWKITADTSNITSATLADLSGALIPLLTGVYYQFWFTLTYRSDTTTSGLKVGLTFPAMTKFSAQGNTQVSATGDEVGVITASGGSIAFSAVNATATDYIAVITGNALPSANGNLQVQVANEAGAGNVIVRQGSCGFAIEF